MTHSGSPSASVAAARDLVLRYGWNANVYQILNPRIAHWHDPAVPAVVGYVRRQKTIVAAGAPLCAEDALPEVVTRFEQWAKTRGDAVCYFGAEDRLRRVLERGGHHATITIGAQPVWDPRGWPTIVQARKSLRAQLNRARNKGITITTLPKPETARHDRGLRHCLNDWLSSKPLPPMHFLVEPDIIDGVLTDRLILVVRKTASAPSDPPVAFLVASPVATRNGYLIEQIARSHDAPNGTAELLIDAAMRELAARNCEYATLGLVALAEHASSEISQNPLWLRGLMAWARAHGNRFYNFRGLEAFRTKMVPDRWDCVYVIGNRPQFSPLMLHAVAAAFSEGPPVLALGRALAKALRKEVRWLGGRLRHDTVAPGSA